MEANTTESVPYNGEESEKRDGFEDMLDKNSTKLDISDILKDVFSNTQLVTDQDDVLEIPEQVKMELNQTQEKLFVCVHCTQEWSFYYNL